MVEVLALALLLAAQASPPDLDARLEAAAHTAMVDGDLKSATEQYNAILASALASGDRNRPVAAQALLLLAQCQERLGQRDAAHASYQRILKEFPDQTAPATRAREKLAAWSHTVAEPRNLNFEHGQTGWLSPSGAAAFVPREGCRTRFACAVVSASGRLTQRFSAAPYRGKTVRLRAWLRVDTALPGDRAQLWLGDDRTDSQQALVDATRWTPCEIAAVIAGDAQSIQFGVLSAGKGRVWIDSVSFQVVPEAEIKAARTAIQKLYSRLDSAFVDTDFGALAALSIADAQYREADAREPLRKAIDGWKSAAQNGPELARHTAVTAIELSGNGAIVNVKTEYIRSEADRTRSVSYVDTRRDTWARVSSDWKLKEYRVLTTRQVDSTTDAQTARLAASDLKRTAAPLATIEVGHTFYDLAPFGAAVGDARIVALGEATFGTREFFRIKHRLLEYLVKEKGFTIFAISANWQEANTLDLYIQTGQGDPKALLTGMLWPWNTEEAFDVVEWMRQFNQAPGPHPTLRFAGFGIPPASIVIPQVVDYLKQCSPLDAVTAESSYAPLLEMESRLGEVYDDGASRAADRAEAVVRLLDARRDALILSPPIQACSASAWRDARQAAETARQNAATRIAGKGSAYRNEMMARNIEWLAKDAYPGEKIVFWGHNAMVGLTPGDPDKSVGTWLRDEFGERIYVTGFAFHRGELLAIGVQNGKYEGVATQTIPPSAEGNGDSVLSAAGMPVFFLDLRSVPAATALGRWLAEPHSFLEVRELWNRDDPQSNAHVKALAKSYDGLIFLEEGHAAHGL